MNGRRGEGHWQSHGKSGKVTVYYTEQGGKKVAHFFEKL